MLMEAIHFDRPTNWGSIENAEKQNRFLHFVVLQCRPRLMRCTDLPANS